MLFQEVSSADGRFDIKAQIIKAAYQWQSFFFVFIRKRYDHRSILLQLHARCLQRLVQCAVQADIIADGFAGGFHFRGQIGIHAVQLCKGESRSLYIKALCVRENHFRNTLFCQRMAQHDLCRDGNQRIARGFG